MEYVVDIQGFKQVGGEVVFKELAIIALEEDEYPRVFLFRPPYSWGCLPENEKVVNRWLELHYHGIPWSSGNISYSRVKKILERILWDASKVYVKGSQKEKWLRGFLPHSIIFNLEYIRGCPSIQELSQNGDACSHHVLCSNSVCAARNALNIKNWLNNDQGVDEVG